MDNYMVYHLHSFLSNPTAGTGADSVTDYRAYIEKASELGMTSICFSEHGSVLNWMEKKQAVEDAGLKYIHANEIYLTKKIDFKEDFLAKKESERGSSIILPEDWQRNNLELERDNYHFMTIAKNYDGVKELNELTSKSFIREDGHFYFNPRLTFDDLKGTSDNIIMTSACLASPIWRMSQVIKGFANKGDEYQKLVKKEYEELMQFFINNKHRMFFEIQYHKHPEQVEFNKMLLQLSKETGVPLIAGTDTHSLNESHASTRNIFLKAKGASYGDEDQFDLTFKSYEELVKMFEEQSAIPRNEYLEAIHNTNVLNDLVEEFELDKTPKYPRIYDNSEELFKDRINVGFKERGLDNLEPRKRTEYLERIRDEYETYKKLDAIDYMLLQTQIIDWCKEKGIKHGYGRGSVTGSLIAYVLGITEMDSIKHELNFFRFLNPDRVSLADIDIDFPSSRRQEVIDYVSSIKGIDFAEIITLNTLAEKGAIKEAGRGLNIPLNIVDEMSKAVDDGTIDRYKNEYAELFYHVENLRGVVTSIGSHPSGVVVSPVDLNSSISTVYTKDSTYKVTAINMVELDSNNYVKLDILGLMNIELINEACELAGIERLTPDNMNIEDEDVWVSMRDSTLGVFQMESDSAHALISQLFSDESLERIRKQTGQVNYISLLSMANGAIRPSGKSYRGRFSQGITNDNGHEALNDFLKDNLGYLIYQEDIMNFLTKFCNHTGSESDTVRRVLAKKKKKEIDGVLPKIRDGFINKMVNDFNDTKEHAEEILEAFMTVINDASDYGFSKNHSDPYSYTGYATTYLRHYYPLEFMTTILNLVDYVPDKAARTAKIMDYMKSKDIKIFPPEFGKSISSYRLDKEEGQIYKGLKSIKYINERASTELFEVAKEEKFSNFIELLQIVADNTSVDTRMMKILIRLDFFKKFGNSRYLEFIYEKFSKRYKKTHKDKTKEQRIVEIHEYQAELNEISVEDYSISEKVMFEKDVLGYGQSTDSTVDKHCAVVTEINTKYSPTVTIYLANSGKEISLKVQKNLFFDGKRNHLLKVGDTIQILKVAKKPKNQMVDGKWVATDIMQNWLMSWVLVEKTKLS